MMDIWSYSAVQILIFVKMCDAPSTEPHIISVSSNAQQLFSTATSRRKSTTRVNQYRFQTVQRRTVLCSLLSNLCTVFRNVASTMLEQLEGTSSWAMDMRLGYHTYKITSFAQDKALPYISFIPPTPRRKCTQVHDSADAREKALS